MKWFVYFQPSSYNKNMITDDTLRQFLPFWERLSDDEKSRLKKSCSLLNFSAGAQVHSGDADCFGVLLLKEGNLRTYMLSEEGREITLFRIEEGDACALSASCILDAITFDVHISALTDAQVIQINNSIFQEMADNNVYIENFIYKTAVDRFSDVMWVMEQVLFMSMDKRLAIFLLDAGPVIPLTHQDIAANLGSAREVVSRMLKYFSDEGLVALSRGKVTVIDRPGLMKIIS